MESKLKNEVEEKFEEIKNALDIRKKLLLRQIDAISSQKQLDSIKFISDNNETAIISLIRNYGKFNIENVLNNMQMMDEFNDEKEEIYNNGVHEIKDIIDSDINSVASEKITINFNKMNVCNQLNLLNESIIHCTLSEARNIIRSVSQGSEQVYDENRNIEEPNDIVIEENIKSISNVSEKDDNKRNKKIIKPNITINNCNGIINLKLNRSNLKINCKNQDFVNLQENTEEDQYNKSSYTQDDEISTNSNLESNTLIESEDKNGNSNSSTITSNSSVNCKFYNRLISQINKTLKHKTLKHSNNNHNQNNGDNNSSSGNISTDNEEFNKHKLKKHIENLEIILNNNNDNNNTVSNNHQQPNPIQIEQWLSDIISETEVEPMQNSLLQNNTNE